MAAKKCPVLIFLPPSFCLFRCRAASRESEDGRGYRPCSFLARISAGRYFFLLLERSTGKPSLWAEPINFSRLSGLARGLGNCYDPAMSEAAAPIAPPETEKKEKTDPRESRDRGYLVICWNDPVNLMDYVTHVFQAVFRWPKAKARRHMLQVHEAGKSLLVRETFEKAEHYVHQLQGYGLHATMEREE